MAYAVQEAKKVYRLTTRLGGYERHQDFPPTEDGLARAMRESRKSRNRGTGQQYGSIDLVDSDGKGDEVKS